MHVHVFAGAGSSGELGAAAARAAALARAAAAVPDARGARDARAGEQVAARAHHRARRPPRRTLARERCAAFHSALPPPAPLHLTHCLCVVYTV